jgi:dGTPase
MDHKEGDARTFKEDVLNAFKTASPSKYQLSVVEERIVGQWIDRLFTNGDRSVETLSKDADRSGISAENAIDLLWRVIQKGAVRFDATWQVEVVEGWPRRLSAVRSRTDRRHRQPAKQGDERGDFERDRDRILFSSAFRRLAGVTQVVAPTEAHPIHNRLTHSLKVAQIGRGLAETLIKENGGDQKRFNGVGGLDPFVVEAAGLAHDLGHPPFGHVAEQELDWLVAGARSNCVGIDQVSPEPGDSRHLCEGFEGNAQSFRIITQLSSRFIDGIPGLDLTRATLCAVLKYPRLYKDSLGNKRKWGAYDSERTDFDFARQLVPNDSKDLRSLEAFLMDWADDIAYAVHDLEDFFRAGLIPLDRLASSGWERDRFLDAEVCRQEKERKKKAPHDPPITKVRLKDVFEPLMQIVPFHGPYSGAREERAKLRVFTSTLIGKYIDVVKFNVNGENGWGEKSVKIEDRYRDEVETLKGLTWFYVIDSETLAAQRYGQRQVIRELFDIYCNAACSGNPLELRVLPRYFRDRVRKPEDDSDRFVRRVAADVIASMSEVQAIETYQRLTGTSFGSALTRAPQ